jgi:biopolymer transport protein ExbD
MRAYIPTLSLVLVLFASPAWGEDSGRVPRPIGVGEWPGFWNPEAWGAGGAEKEAPVGGTGSDAVQAALKWLARHQGPDGMWRCADFAKICDAAKACSGEGTGSDYDMGVTGLALLAFLGAGNTHTRGMHKGTVKNALKALKDRQTPDGCFGRKTGGGVWIYNHMICTFAWCEAYSLTRSVLLESWAQKAVDFLVSCQNPDSGWRYGVRPGQSDTSCTIWAVLALTSARLARREIPAGTFEGARKWLDKVTDGPSSRTGYLTPGDPGSRLTSAHKNFDSSEAMTAGALAARMFMGAQPRDPVIEGGWALLEAGLPAWDKSTRKVDLIYWYFGTQVAFRRGGGDWQSWATALGDALIPKQRKTGCAAGSWDPSGPWGSVGGRVYSTALAALALEIYCRFPPKGAPRKQKPTISAEKLAGLMKLPAGPSPGTALKGEWKIPLPSVENGAPLNGKRGIVIDVRASGRVFLEGKAFGLDGLSERLKMSAEELRDQEDPRKSDVEVLIRADGRAPWSHVRHILLLCAQPGAGIHRICFAADLNQGRRRNDGRIGAYLPVWRTGMPWKQKPPPLANLKLLGGGRCYVGNIFCGKGAKGLERALEKISKARKGKSGFTVQIDGASDVPFSRVVAALDGLIDAQVEGIWFIG